MTNSKTRDIRLTPRQTEILSLFWQGKTYDRIADELNISAATVRCHLASVRDKFHVSNTTSALYIARSLGIIT